MITSRLFIVNFCQILKLLFIISIAQYFHYELVMRITNFICCFFRGDVVVFYNF